MNVDIVLNIDVAFFTKYFVRLRIIFARESIFRRFLHWRFGMLPFFII